MDNDSLPNVPIDGLPEEAVAVMAWQARTMPELFGRAFPPAPQLQLRDRALAELVDLILSGQLGVGSLTSENRVADLLSQKLGQEVSRTPVGQAVAILSREGFVRQFPQRGFEVVQVSADETLEALSLCSEVEALSMRRLVTSGIPAGIGPLEAAQNELNQAIQKSNRHGFMLAETDFHVGLALCAGIRDAVRSIGMWRKKVHLYSLTRTEPNHLMGFFAEEHKGIIDAILSRQVDQALASADRHMEHTLMWLGLAGTVQASTAAATQPELATVSR